MVTTEKPAEPEGPAPRSRLREPKQIALWTAVAVVGAVAWAIVALSRGEEISAAWLQWAAAPDGWIAIPHGEIICRAGV